MNAISAEQLLSQIRAMSASLQPPAAPPVGGPGQTGFGDLLKNAVQGVNGAQQDARRLAIDFQSGEGEASLAQVMIASQKADIQFRAMTEVRNKLVSAYQEIMNMPV